MEEYKARFSNEVSELLEGVEGRLLQLEKDRQNKESIAELFRVMHTIKGTATMFGFSNMGVITHEVEDLLHLIREELLAVDDEVLSISFDVIDLLREMLSTGDVLTSEMETKFKGLLTRVHNKNDNKTDGKIDAPKVKDPPLNADSVFYYIRYQPDEDILSRGVDPLGIFDELEDEGNFIAFLDLTQVPKVENFQTEKSFLAWDIFCSGFNDQETIEDVFLFFLDHEYSVKPFQLTDLESDIFNTDMARRLQSYGINESNISERLIAMSDKYNEVYDKEVSQSAENNQSEQTEKICNESIETIRVDAARLDELINLVSELVTINGELELQATELDNLQLQKRVSKLSKLSKKFRDNALDLRLVPVDVLSVKMGRLVRDLAGELGKDVEFITEGTSTELDKSIIARLESPVLHIIRNCVDHAIEKSEERRVQSKPAKGVVRFIAFYSGANVFIQIQDDGRGIDPGKVKTKAVEKGIISANQTLSNDEAYNLIFAPGFSTTNDVSNVSGRGVGLDSVRKQIADMRGQVDVESEVGLGTSITIKLPLTLSIIDTLMTRVGEHAILVPIEYIVKTMLVHDTEAKHIAYNDSIIPFINMREVLNEPSEPGKMRVLIIRHYNNRYAIAVNRIDRDYQAVVKPLGAYNRHHPFFSGSSILGDGTLALILDINRLIKYQKQNKL